jgi:hypothetical protein
MKSNNTFVQLKICLYSFFKKNDVAFKYMNTSIDHQTAAEYIYPLICHLSESEFLYYFDREKLDAKKALFMYSKNSTGSIFQPYSVEPTGILSKISFSTISPFFFFWMKNLVENYADQLELIYIHFPESFIFKN